MQPSQKNNKTGAIKLGGKNYFVSQKNNIYSKKHYEYKVENKGLLFIPDISGFTRFVNETEIDHSRLIIQELLELLINANNIGLEVSEVEGDAILFYKFGESPDMKELYKQVEKMFREFTKHLLAYDYRRYCQCKACTSAVDLSLKVITHYGEFTGYKVKNFNKLIGKDVIVAHQLLKNEIEQNEYWLVTNNLWKSFPPEHADFAEWMQWNSAAKKTENGEIPFHYTQLSPLKNEITQEPPQHSAGAELSKKIKMISVTKEYETDIITLFHASGDFNYRHRWQEGVKATEEVNHFLPRVGMRCKCIMEDGQTSIYSSSYSYSTDRIEFSETDDKNESTTNYILENTGNKTRLTINFYIKKNPASQILFKLTKQKETESMFNKSLLNLTELVKEIKLPGIN